MVVRPLALAGALLLTACAYPTTSVRTLEEKPRLAFANASPTAMLFINGILIGPAADYDGKKNTLQVGTGTHTVEVRENDRVVLSEKIYLGSDMTKTISLPK